MAVTNQADPIGSFPGQGLGGMHVEEAGTPGSPAIGLIHGAVVVLACGLFAAVTQLAEPLDVLVRDMRAGKPRCHRFQTTSSVPQVLELFAAHRLHDESSSLAPCIAFS